MTAARERGQADGRRLAQLRPRTRRIVVHIPNFRIEGKIEFLEQSRFTDFLNAEQYDFVLLRDAQVVAADSGRVHQSLPELQVNKDVITMAYLVE